MKKLRDPLAQSISPRAKKAPAVDRFTAHVRDDLAERVRNAVHFVPGLTVRAITEDGLLRAVEQYEKQHNKGKPFPQRPHALKGGRPPK